MSDSSRHEERRRETDGLREQFTALSEQLCDLEVTIAEINVKLENMHSSKNRMHEEVMGLMNKVTHTLYGNGQPGVTTVIYKHEDEISNIKRDVRYCLIVCILAVGFTQAAKFLIPLIVK